MANDFVFTEEEMAIDDGVGYPRAYAKLCRDKNFGPFSHGPPFTFTPYALVQQEDSRAKELDEMFPIIDLKAKPTSKPKIFVSLLWKQLNHLGNAGFDPEIIRVDPYGNVLYYHADSASPLAWDIDHWFPCSRGGLTVPSNLRILQWQVCKRKHNKLEFLIPWWDFQLGISINQFLSIFASSNSDFRRRAFSWLFYEGESEELNASQTVDSHIFPQHFLESQGNLGLAPAAVVLSRKESFDPPLRSLDVNRRPRSITPIIACKKVKNIPKENENNPYQAMVLARHSLKQREETVKMKAEIQRLDHEVIELQKKTEDEKISIQELENVLIKKRRRAEKCRRVAESQCSYRVMLEKMIRDAMHQSVVYKEQVRLNQAAASALSARLEAQKAICDSAERELYKRYKQRDELEKQIRPEWEQARKRSRMDDSNEDRDNDNKITLCLPENDDDSNIYQVRKNNDNICLPEIESSARLHKESSTLYEDRDDYKITLCLPENDDDSNIYQVRKNDDSICLPEIESRCRLHKELRKFLEEDHSASSSSLQNEQTETNNNCVVEERFEKLEIENGGKIYDIQFPFHHEPDEEEDEEIRKQRGKGNLEKWMQFLLENSQENYDNNGNTTSDELVKKLNLIYPHREIKVSTPQESTFTKTPKNMEKIESEKINLEKNYEKKETGKGSARMSSPDESIRRAKIGKENKFSRSNSFRALKRIPSSPSLIMEGMKKRVDWIRKKPLVFDDGDEENNTAPRKSFVKSSFKTIKKAVGI